MIKLGAIEQGLQAKIDEGKKLFIILLDPDSEVPEKIIASGINAAKAGADVIFIGGSFIGNPAFTKITEGIRAEVNVPIILFPGGASQVTPGPDAILFTTLISGRNPQYLIDEQVKGAVLSRKLNMEPIPTAYLLIESGGTTAVEYISQTRPIPANMPAIAAAHALAAQYMGQRWVYLEAGSGAKNPVPPQMVALVGGTTSMNVIVGGGIRTPELAHERVKAGAHAIVIGNFFEGNKDESLYKAFSDAIHV